MREEKTVYLQRNACYQQASSILVCISSVELLVQAEFPLHQPVGDDCTLIPPIVRYSSFYVFCVVFPTQKCPFNSDPLSFCDVINLSSRGSVPTVDFAALISARRLRRKISKLNKCNFIQFSYRNIF